MAQAKQFKDRFTQYLEKKFGSSQKANLWESSEKKNRQSQFSFDSSKLDLAEFNKTPIRMNNHVLQQTNNIFSHSISNTTNKPKKLRKCKDIQQNVCAICLQEIKSQAQLQCKHRYCQQCLINWLNQSSKCPFCRQQSQYYVCRGKTTKIQPKQMEKQQQYQQLDSNCYMCMNAQQGDVLIVCDRCQGYSCHPMCDENLRGRIPEHNQQWICHQCRHNL